MLKDLLITRKFPFVMISFALLSALVTGLIAYTQTTNALNDNAKTKLYALLESRETALKQYFENIEKDLSFQAQSNLVETAFSEFKQAWDALPNDRKGYLHTHYRHENPYIIGQKDYLLSINDESDYSSVHKRYHSFFAGLIASKKLHDILLLDSEGNIIYTVAKENDFATNIFNQSKTSGLATVFSKITQQFPNNILAAFSDFKPYAPSANKPAGFIATPVFDNNNQLLGVLAFQLSIDAIDEIMQVTAGMGQSGETYLVGKDLTMRSDSRFYSGRSILKTKVDTPSVRNAFEGEEGVQVINDYRNISVYSAYKPIEFMGVTWAMLAEIDENEILKPVHQLRQYLVISGLIIATIIASLGYLLAADLARPIMTMAAAMKKLADNDLTVNISVCNRKDEVGLMAKSLMYFKETATEREKLRAELIHMAKHDALTALPNRAHAMEYLDQLLDKAKIETGLNVSIIYADLDGFKPVNDKYGHHVGDLALKEVSNRLTTCLDNDGMVARIGGDEFIVILSCTNIRRKTEQVARNILRSIAKPFDISDHSMEMGISLGISMFPSHASKTDKLLQLADEAMYKAKAKGKNRFIYAQADEDACFTGT